MVINKKTIPVSVTATLMQSWSGGDSGFGLVLVMRGSMNGLVVVVRVMVVEVQ